MYGVELYAAVRLAVVEEGLSHHEAGRRFGIDRRTVKKMLRYSAPPGYRRRKPVRRPKLDGFPSDEAATKLLFLAIRNAGMRWKRPVAWTAAMGQFAILFEDRFPASAR